MGGILATDLAPVRVRPEVSAYDPARASWRTRFRPRRRAYALPAYGTGAVLSCATLTLALMACGQGRPMTGDRSPQGAGIEVRELAAGLHGGPSEPTEAVISNPERLTAVWPAAAERPAIDFSREAVILVALGQRPTGGYEVEITTVQARGDTAVVLYVERRPGPRCMTTQALTSPYHIVAIAPPPGSVRFEGETLTREC